MPSILNLARETAPHAPEPKLASAPEAAEESVEFEIVVGRRQAAGMGLVAIVLVAVFSGVSYLIGKSMAPAAAAATPASVVPAPAVQVTPAVQAAPAEQVPATQTEPKTTTAPLFGDTAPGKVYLQVGAIEKGLAAIWAEGLRTHGLDAFVTAAPGDKQWRVLIGPLPDPQAYQRAKDTLDTLGLTNFGRRYSQ